VAGEVGGHRLVERPVVRIDEHTACPQPPGNRPVEGGERVRGQPVQCGRRHRRIPRGVEADCVGPAGVGEVGAHHPRACAGARCQPEQQRVGVDADDLGGRKRARKPVAQRSGPAAEVDDARHSAAVACARDRPPHDVDHHPEPLLAVGHVALLLQIPPLHPPPRRAHLHVPHPVTVV
jgi:hypothetical protein